jgi:hypothetical protein
MECQGNNATGTLTQSARERGSPPVRNLDGSTHPGQRPLFPLSRRLEDLARISQRRCLVRWPKGPNVVGFGID